MSGFEERNRMPEAEARERVFNGSAAVMHLLKNDDGTFSIMSHIVCEFCDYCDEERDDEAPAHPNEVRSHVAKPDPYEKVGPG